MADDIISDAIDMLEKLRSEEEVTVKFKKRSTGETRIMKCTLNFDNIPQTAKPKGIDLPKIMKLIRNKKIIHMFDLEKRGWRSIPVDESEWMETPTRRFSIKVK